MITKERRASRDIRHRRLRRFLHGSGARPRLAVFRSLNHIYAQLVDDDAGRTLLAVDSRSKAFRARQPSGGNVAAAKLENARLLEESREKHRLEEDLRLAASPLPAGQRSSRRNRSRH